MHRAQIAGSFEDHAVAGVDQAAHQQIESLLRAGDDQNVLGWTAEA